MLLCVNVTVHQHFSFIYSHTKHRQSRSCLCWKLLLIPSKLIKPLFQMFSRAAVRATTQVTGRRGFHATRPRMISPYHYAEGPYTNIPFNPKAKTFPILFWGYAATGFGLPFMIASAWCRPFAMVHSRRLTDLFYSMANIQAQGLSCDLDGSGGHGRLPCYRVEEHELGSGATKTLRWIDSTIDIFSNSIFTVSQSCLCTISPWVHLGGYTDWHPAQRLNGVLFKLQHRLPAGSHVMYDA